MGTAQGSGFRSGRSASPGAGGVVSRPGLFGRLGAAQVTVVSAPAGSGKTVLLRSWIGEAALAERAAWVPVARGERDPQRFWLSVLGALRQTAPGSGLVRELTPAPDLDGWAIVERLLKDLASLRGRLWLVIDDVHELGSAEALRQLELLLMRAPPELRFVLATRHDLRLGLHRLRLEGELTEIRAAHLRFSLADARELFAAAGVELPGSALEVLHARTEGWAAGLRLAALSLAGHPDPERFAAEFSGSERTVAEYLLAEVLERQSEEVRRLLLRTSILEQVNGELADALTGDEGGERVLQELQAANAFVVSVDAARSWFRYTGCSPTCCNWSCAGPHRMRSPRCTIPLRSGMPTMDTRWRRSGTPRRRRTGDWPFACWPTTGQACNWTGRSRPCMRCSPGSRPRPARQMLSLRRSPRPTSWLGDHWMWRSSTWAWRRGDRCRWQPGAGASCRCCSGWSGCCWPGSAGTCRRWPRRRGGCRPWPRRRTRRSLAWARSCARWR